MNISTSNCKCSHGPAMHYGYPRRECFAYRCKCLSYKPESMFQLDRDSLIGAGCLLIGLLVLFFI